MGKPGRGQANAIDKLDASTRDKCINLMLSGRKGCDAEVARLAGVSRQAIFEYRRRHLDKALELASKLVRAEATEQLDTPTQMQLTAKASREIAAALPILAVREKRLAALQDRHDRMHLVMSERADDMEAVPGGKSGLLVRSLKQIGAGPTAQIVEEYKLDASLLSEFREHEKQVAMELGQWQETASVGGSTTFVLVAMPQAAPAETAPQLLAAEDVSFDDTLPGEWRQES